MAPSQNQTWITLWELASTLTAAPFLLPTTYMYMMYVHNGTEIITTEIFKYNYVLMYVLMYSRQEPPLNLREVFTYGSYMCCFMLLGP